MHDAVDCGVDLFGGHRAKCAPRERRPQAEIAEVVAKDQCVCGQTGSVGHAVFGQLFETRRTHVLRHSLTGQNGSERQQVRNASAVLIPRVERSDQIGPNLVEVNAVSGVRRERIASGHDVWPDCSPPKIGATGTPSIIGKSAKSRIAVIIRTSHFQARLSRVVALFYAGNRSHQLAHNRCRSNCFGPANCRYAIATRHLGRPRAL
ncbi:hypothetical protein [Mycolicibacterium fortuitum]